MKYWILKQIWILSIPITHILLNEDLIEKKNFAIEDDFALKFIILEHLLKSNPPLEKERRSIQIVQRYHFLS